MELGELKKIGGHLWRWRLLTAIVVACAVYGVQFWILHLPEAQAAYSIANSARFNDDDSAYLSKTFGASAATSTWTMSFWVKRGNLGLTATIWSADTTSDDRIFFNSSDQLAIDIAGTARLVSSQVFRDPAAWNHFVIMYDAASAVNAQKMRVYVDGSEITVWGTDARSGISTAIDSKTSKAVASAVGRRGNGATNYFDGYLSDFYLINSTTTASSFGETDGNGYWRPKTFSGSYGTNGFKLDFATGSDLGNDVSGNANDWTANALDATDQTIDTPTNGFPTLNSVWKPSISTYTNGNMSLSRTGTDAADTAPVGVSSGKWYFEAYMSNDSGVSNVLIGVANPLVSKDLTLGQDANGWAFYPVTANGCVAGSVSCKYTGGTVTSYGSSYASVAASNQVYGIALDMDTGEVFVRDSAGWIASSDPVAGTGEMFSGLVGPLMPALGHDAGVSRSTSATMILGQLANPTSTATTLTYSSAAGGYFMYTPPTGFKALSTANLPEPTITVPKDYFDAKTYTGSGSSGSQNFTSSGTFTVPNYTSLTVTVTGTGGGGGGGAESAGQESCPEPSGVTGTAGTAGGASSFNSTVVGNGGSGGGGGGAYGGGCNPGSGGTGGSGGTASGGDTNVTGTAGTTPGAGGSGGAGGGNGGTGGASGTGDAKGGGGGGGGGGGVATKTYTSGQLTVGAGITVTVGGGGGGGAGGGNGNTGVSGTGGSVAITWTGTGQSITGLNFQPDIAWLKDRISTNVHGIFDSLRTATKYWSSNASTAETTDTTTLSSFDAAGFTVGSTTVFNNNNSGYISWLWKESPATSGVDVVTYSGDNTANRDISHSLGKRPAFAIVKRRDSAEDPFVWHGSMSSSSTFALLDSTAATSTTNSPWCVACENGNWGATTFRVTNNATNNANAASATYVAYLFATTTDFSQFGRYVGNGSADGPFVFTGFKPRFIMVKRADTTGSWYQWDTARDTFNVATSTIVAETTAAQTAATSLDFLANGFKLRSTTAGFNASGGTYIYAAFADVPFKYSAASATSASSFVQAIAFLMGMTF